MTVVATAGHVDHGKSSLVHALTGTDPDRLGEERERGLTIDLGFATMELPSGSVSFIDVPGHHRFLGNMLAGVGEVDACLFVVAATEGWKTQSEEHLAILQAVGVTGGVVALTKVDLVGESERRRVRSEVEQRLSESPLKDSSIIDVSSVTSTGLDELTEGLDQLLRTVTLPVDRDRPRLWIDRMFTVRGSGTVVTGTLAGGSLHVGGKVTIEPAGVQARIRTLQNHNQNVERIGPGNRVGVNLVRLPKAVLGRGHAVVEPGRWHLTRVLDAQCQVLATSGHALTRRGAHALHLGTGNWQVRLQIIGADSIEPGQTGYLRAYLPQPIPLVPGDRFVIRDLTRWETIAGGEVLDVAPVLPTPRARPDRSIDRVVRERGWVESAELERLTGEYVQPSIGQWVVSPAALAKAATALAERVTTGMPIGVDLASLTDQERSLVEDGAIADITIRDGYAVRADRPDSLVYHPWLNALEIGGFAPPQNHDLTAAEVKALVIRGLVMNCGGVYFHPRTIDRSIRLVIDILNRNPAGFTLAEARDAMQTTRKYALALLNQFDTWGYTVRDGNRRRAGPALSR